MNDKDIIKGLVHIIVNEVKSYDEYKRKGGMKDVERETKIDVLIAALDLIKRQQDEIERLINIKADMLEEKGGRCFDAGYIYATKEFAERLKEKSDYYSDLPFKTVDLDEIDTIEKEMLGKEDE